MPFLTQTLLENKIFNFSFILPTMLAMSKQCGIYY